MTLTPITVLHVIDGQLEQFGRTDGPVITAPSQPVAVATSAITSSSATLSWQPPLDNGGSPITGYAVSRDGAGGTTVTVGPATRSQQFRTLTASTTYHLSVAAINGSFTGPVATRTITTPAGPGPVGGMRFPGDPNPMANNGTLYLGMSLGKGLTMGQFETSGPVGTYHLYWDYGRTPNALTVPSGPMAQAAQAAHAAGQLPLLSWHMPGGNWASGANGAYDAQIDAWIAWCESQAKPIYWVVNHEPETDGTAANYRAWMQHVRSRITLWEQAHGPRQRLVFLMCLVAVTFTGNQGGMAAWWPGDGVVDVLGLDHYGSRPSSRTYISPDTYFTSAWRAFLAFAQSKNIPFFLCEYGWLPDHPNAAAEYQQLYDLMTSGSYDCIGMSYFDSGWWVLTDNNGMTSKHKALLRAADSIHMSDLGY